MKNINISTKLALGCNLFHFYAFSLYVFSAVSLAPVFFNSISESFSQNMALMTISISIILKPLGSLMFGHIGDTYGRKLSLLLSTAGVAIFTTLMGFIPSYETIGSLSGAMLILCIFFQGVGVGGQYSGVLVLVQEHTDRKHSGLACGLVISFGIVGTLLGTSTLTFFKYLVGGDLAWRLPFLMILPIGGVLLTLLMKNLKESPTFESKQSRHYPSKYLPLWIIIKEFKKVIVAGVFISAFPISAFYMAAVYIPNFLHSSTGYKVDPLPLTLLSQFLCILFVPLFAYTADLLGKEKQLLRTSLLAIIIPFFLMSLSYLLSLNTFSLIYIVLLCVFTGLYGGASTALITERLPVIGRYSGLGIGISLGEGIFGGLTPLACVYLQEIFDSPLASSFLLTILGFISFIGLVLIRQKSIPSYKAEGLEPVAHSRMS